MLGWNLRVYRQPDGHTGPATWHTATGHLVAAWQTGPRGLQWLGALVREGGAIDLGGRGYPSRYTAPARHLVPRIRGGPPEARERWAHDPHDVLGEDWPGRTTIDHAAIRECGPDEWLLVEAWDES